MTPAFAPALTFRARVYFTHDPAKATEVRDALGLALGQMTSRVAYATDVVHATDGGRLGEAIWLAAATAEIAAQAVELTDRHFIPSQMADEFRQQARPALRKAVVAGETSTTNPAMFQHCLWRATVFMATSGCQNAYLRDAAYLAVSGAPDAAAASWRIGDLINWLEAVRSAFDRMPEPASSPQGEAPGVAS